MKEPCSSEVEASLDESMRLYNKEKVGRKKVVVKKHILDSLHEDLCNLSACTSRITLLQVRLFHVCSCFVPEWFLVALVTRCQEVFCADVD